MEDGRLIDWLIRSITVCLFDGQINWTNVSNRRFTSMWMMNDKSKCLIGHILLDWLNMCTLMIGWLHEAYLYKHAQQNMCPHGVTTGSVEENKQILQSRSSRSSWLIACWIGCWIGWWIGWLIGWPSIMASLPVVGFDNELIDKLDDRLIGWLIAGLFE